MNELTQVKVLGKGSYGIVHLVEDVNGNQYALKVISKQKLQKQPYLEDYLKDQIRFMDEVCGEGDNLVNFYKSSEDDKNYYLQLEYCKGGDLSNEQMKSPGMVFTLEKAVPILVQIINGLAQIHEKGYIHRDLKTENILVQIDSQGQHVYKLADFGFTKQEKQTEGTVLGTEYYMSPEVYSEDKYTHKVDVWAFGVLMFYMLNKEYPFPPSHCAASPAAKKKKLQSLAKNFSYKKAVKQTRKNIKENCTPQMESLFKKMFELNPEKRIDFYQIRKHDIFAKHFGEVPQFISAIYSMVNKKPKALSESKIIKQPKPIKIKQSCTIVSKIGDRSFRTMLKELEEINFIFYNEFSITEEHKLNFDIRAFMSYHLLRMHLILLKQLSNKIDLLVKTSKMKPAYSDKINEQINETKSKSYDKYSRMLQYLKSINESQQREDESADQFQKRIQIKNLFSFTYFAQSDEEFNVCEEEFKKSYSKAMKVGYDEIRLCKSQKLDQLLLFTVFSYLYLKIVQRPQPLETIFAQFFQKTELDIAGQFIEELRVWVKGKDRKSIIGYAAKLYKEYQS